MRSTSADAAESDGGAAGATAEAGTTQALVSAIGRGKANPTLASLERIAQVLEVDLSELFARERAK